MRALRVLMGAILTLAALMPSAATARQGEATIATFNSQGQRSNDFARNEAFVVLGSGFPGQGSVDVAFEQDDPAGLGTFSVAEDGTFRADVRVPQEATVGAATIRATSGATTASQGIEVVPGPAGGGGTPTPDGEGSPGPSPTGTEQATSTAGAGGGATSPGADDDPLTPDAGDDDSGGLVDSFLDFWPWILGVLLIVGGGVFLAIRWRQRQEGAGVAGDEVPSLDELDWDDEDFAGDDLDADDDATTDLVFEDEDDFKASTGADEDSDMVIEPPTRGAGLVDDPSPPRMPVSPPEPTGDAPPPEATAAAGPPEDAEAGEETEENDAAPEPERRRPRPPSTPPAQPDRPGGRGAEDQGGSSSRDPGEADRDEFAVTEEKASDAISKLRRDVTNWRRSKD